MILNTSKDPDRNLITLFLGHDQLFQKCHQNLIIQALLNFHNISSYLAVDKNELIDRPENIRFAVRRWRQ